MSSSALLNWLERDDWPQHFYELLGRPLFDPDLPAMGGEITAAARQLLPYQTHVDAGKARRAMQLLTEYVGEAAAVLSDETRLREIHERLYEELRQKYAHRFGADASPPAEEIRKWLQEEEHVHPAAVEELLPMLGEHPVPPRRESRIFSPPAADRTVRTTVSLLVDSVEDGASSVRQNASPLTQKSADSGSVAAVSRKQPVKKSPPPVPPQLPAADSPADPPLILPEEKNGWSEGQMAALVAALLGIPLILLIAVLIWLATGENPAGSSSPAGKSAASLADSGKTAKTPAEKTGSGDGAVVRPTKGSTGGNSKSVVGGNGGKPSATEPRTYDGWMQRAARSTGAERRTAYRKALALAQTPLQKSRVYSRLADDKTFLAGLTWDQIAEAVDALASQSNADARIYVEQLKTTADVRRLISRYVTRLQRDRKDNAAQYGLYKILSNKQALAKLSADDLNAVYAEIFPVLPSAKAQQIVRNNFVLSLKFRNTGLEVLPRCIVWLKRDDVPKASVLLAAHIMGTVLARAKTATPAEVITMCEAMVWLVRRNTTDAVRKSNGKYLYDTLNRLKSVPHGGKYLRTLLARKPNDLAAPIILNQFAEGEFAQARQLNGIEKILAIDEALQWAPTQRDRLLLAGRLIDDEQYLKLANFETGLLVYEGAVLIYVESPANQPLDRSTVPSVVFKLLNFVTEHNRLADVRTRCRQRKERDAGDIVARLILSGDALAQIVAIAKRSGPWTVARYSEVDRALQDAEAPIRAVILHALLSRSDFREGLTFNRYLQLREMVLADALKKKTREETMLGLLTDLQKQTSLKIPNRTLPTDKTKAAAHRFEYAVQHYRNRSRQNPSSIASRELLLLLLLFRKSQKLYVPATGETIPSLQAKDDREITQIKAELQKLKQKKKKG